MKLRHLALGLALLSAVACSAKESGAAPAKGVAPAYPCQLVAEPASTAALWHAFLTGDVATFEGQMGTPLDANALPDAAQAAQFIANRDSQGVTSVEWVASCAQAAGGARSFYVMHRASGHPDLSWMVLTDAAGKVVGME